MKIIITFFNYLEKTSICHSKKINISNDFTIIRNYENLSNRMYLSLSILVFRELSLIYPIIYPIQILQTKDMI